MATITSRNPYTKEINGTFETYADIEIIKYIEKAYTSYLTRKDTPKAEKKKLFLKLADILEENIEYHAKNETIEMGRLLWIAINWMKWTVSLIRRFANNFEQILTHEPVNSEWLIGHIQYDPLGVIYGIAPRNFPYNQLLRAAVPNILAGNTVVYKHASNVPLCAKAIQELFIQAWFPEGVYTNIYSSASQSELIISHPYIRGINLTGGEKVWSVIWALAGKYLKPSVLELGGNDPFILLDHKDTAKMVAAATACRISNNGQRCNSSKRFIILERYYDDFCNQMAEYMSKLIIGDPMDAKTQISSLATAWLLQELDHQVQSTIQQWAKCLTGGNILDEERQIYAPTVLADITPEMTSYQQETFGPVASIMKAKDIEDAIKIANNNDLWLSAVVYGDDIEQCKFVADHLEWGMIFINQSAGSKASLPFWWVKKSGYGKENGPDGLKAFTNKKVVIY